jgi:uncharacterized protein YkwD
MTRRSQRILGSARRRSNSTKPPSSPRVGRSHKNDTSLELPAVSRDLPTRTFVPHIPNHLKGKSIGFKKVTKTRTGPTNTNTLEEVYAILATAEKKQRDKELPPLSWDVVGYCIVRTFLFNNHRSFTF